MSGRHSTAFTINQTSIFFRETTELKQTCDLLNMLTSIRVPTIPFQLMPKESIVFHVSPNLGSTSRQIKTKKYIYHANSIPYSQAATHPSTNGNRHSLTSERWRDRVRSMWYGCWHQTCHNYPNISASKSITCALELYFLNTRQSYQNHRGSTINLSPNYSQLIWLIIRCNNMFFHQLTFLICSRCPIRRPGVKKISHIDSSNAPNHGNL